MKVWKYLIGLYDLIVYVPLGSEFLHAGVQDDRYFVWMKVDPKEEKMTQRGIQIIGTGHDIPEDMRHLATFQHGPFVWHVFVDGQ